MKINSILLGCILMLFSCTEGEVTEKPPGSDTSEIESTIDVEISNQSLVTKSDSVIGTWKGDWYKGDRIELIVNDDIYYRKNYYTDGNVVSHVLERRDTSGIYSYVNTDETSLEYYRIETNGNLGRYSKWTKIEEIEKL